MSKITKANEIELPELIVGAIYGQPGVGKTTIAVSMPKTLLIDADRGVHRINIEHRTDTVQVENFQDILDVLEEDLSEYESIAIDTMGAVTTFMLDYFATKDPSLVTRGGTYNIKIWGLVLTQLDKMILKLRRKGIKYLTYVFHAKEKEDNDKTTYRIDMPGSGGARILKELDFLGFCEMVGKHRTICFSPCDRYYAKNSIHLDDLVQIPILDEGVPNTFMFDNIIKPSIERRQKEQEEHKATDEAIAKGRALIAKSKDPNKTLDEFKKMDLTIYAKTLLFNELCESTELEFQEGTFVEKSPV